MFNPFNLTFHQVFIFSFDQCEKNMIETPQKNSQSQRGDRIKELESENEQLSPVRKEKKVG